MRAVAVATCTLLLFASCSSDSTAPSTVAALKVNLSNTGVTVGQTATATVSATDQYGVPMSTNAVTWTSSSATVATVNATGAITAIGAGTTQIVATLGGTTGQASFTVSAAPALAGLNVLANTTTITYGQTATFSAFGYDQNGVVFNAGAVTWTSSAPNIASVNATTGIATGVLAGTAQITATAGGKSVAKAITVTAPPQVVVNEVESNGGVPGDWIELYNNSSAPVDLSGWGVRDNDSTHTIWKFPAGTIIQPGGFALAEEADFGFGLGAADEARLYNPFGVLVDIYAWTAHATITYSRCPDGTGPFAQSLSTKGARNNCNTSGGGGGGSGPVDPAWPTTDAITFADGLNTFGTNLSGLMYETPSGGRPAVLWGIQNGPSKIWRLIMNGGIWTPDPANGWAQGKTITFADSTGGPDSEGITFTSAGSAGGMYVSVERDNNNNGVSRITVLRVDVTSPTNTILRPTNEWNLTPDLPVSGPNLGAEAIAWVPDSFLVAKSFFDEKAGKKYNPADYPNHGTGLLFVGLESNAIVYAYALNHANGTYNKLATIPTGYPAGVMDLNFDPATGYLWAVCDDTCGGVVGILEIENIPASPNFGRFRAPRRFARPATMPNINNEGFAVSTQAECVNGKKPVWWADDNNDDGHAIRQGTLPCGVIAAPPPSMPSLFAPAAGAPTAPRKP